MIELSGFYRPLTARPFLSDSSYREIVPCEALRPYIVCFWESGGGKASSIRSTVLSQAKQIACDNC